jgi:hypothetical protein
MQNYIDLLDYCPEQFGGLYNSLDTYKNMLRLFYYDKWIDLLRSHWSLPMYEVDPYIFNLPDGVEGHEINYSTEELIEYETKLNNSRV